MTPVARVLALSFSTSGSARYVCTSAASLSLPKHDVCEQINEIEYLVRERCKSGTLTLEEALQVFDKMLQLKPSPSIYPFTQLLGAISKMSHYSTTLELYKQMTLNSQVNSSIDVCTLNILLNSYCRLDRGSDLGFAVLGVFLKRGCEPNARTLNTLLKGLFDGGNIEQGVKLFHGIISECYPCDHFTANIVISGLCKLGRTNIVMDLIPEMEKIGHKPDVTGYTSLIHSLCKKGDWKEAERLFCQMSKFGIVPDIFSFTILIDAVCKQGMLKEATDLLSEMTRRGIKPDIVTYNSLIDGYCKVKKIDEAMHTFMSMQENPSVVTYSLLIDGLCKSGKLKEAREIFHSMTKSKVVPNVVTYSSMIDGLCRGGYLQEAYDLFVKMEENGCQPNEVTLNLILRGFAQENKIDKVTQILRQMDERGFSPYESTKVVLIKLLDTNELDESSLRMLHKLLPEMD